MSRLFFLLAVVAVVYLLLRTYRKQPPHNNSSAEDMVRCAQCGVHLPRSEALMAGGNFYCCDAHRQAHQSK